MVCRHSSRSSSSLLRGQACDAWFRAHVLPPAVLAALLALLPLGALLWFAALWLRGEGGDGPALRTLAAVLHAATRGYTDA